MFLLLSFSLSSAFLCSLLDVVRTSSGNKRFKWMVIMNNGSAAEYRQKALIEISGLNKWFGSFHVLRDIFVVTSGERIVICGPSGSGKSTLIRCINYLEGHQEGHIFVDGIELKGDLKNIEAVGKKSVWSFNPLTYFHILRF